MLQSKTQVSYSPSWRRQCTRVVQQLVAVSAADVDQQATAPDNQATLRLTGMPWLGNRVPNGYWDIRENRVHYLEWLGEQCGFLTATDWYRLRRHHFQRNGGGGLLRNVYGSSVLTAMLDFLPDYPWTPWLFGGAPNGFWTDAKNRHCYMDWLGQELGFSKTEDWYAVTGAHFFGHHGGGLLNNCYAGSVQAILLDYRPDFAWEPWRFHSVPQSFWNEASNRKEYLHWLGRQLGYTTRKDWDNLKREHLVRHNGSGVFAAYYHGSIPRLLDELFPAAGASPATRHA